MGKATINASLPQHELQDREGDDGGKGGGSGGGGGETKSKVHTVTSYTDGEGYDKCFPGAPRNTR